MMEIVPCSWTYRFFRIILTSQCGHGGQSVEDGNNVGLYQSQVHALQLY